MAEALRVTRVLELNGLTDLSFVTLAGLERGTDVHAATAFDDRGTLEESSVDERVRPLLESWRAFRSEAGLTIRAVELGVSYPALNYRGTLDRVVAFRGRAADVLIDLKGGGPLAWHPYQTAAYAMAYAAQTKGPTPERGSVYLQADGRPARFVSHKDRGDFDEWKALVVVAHLKQRLGL